MIARFWNAGQSCLAAKRLYVFDEIYDEFVGGLARSSSATSAATGWTKAGEAEAPDGPGAHAAGGRDELAEQLEDPCHAGRKVLFGGGPPSDREKGYFFAADARRGRAARLAPRARRRSSARSSRSSG